MKKVISILLALALGLLPGCGGTPEPEALPRIALVSLGPEDARSEALEAGAHRAAEELGAELAVLPLQVSQARAIRAAQASGYQALVVSPDGTADSHAALEEVAAKGMKLVYVETTDAVQPQAALTPEPEAAGRAAAQAMLTVLEARRIRSGRIDIISPDPADETAARREAGFRSAFKDTDFTLSQTRYDRGYQPVAAMLARDGIWQGAVGIYGCAEVSALGAGQAVQSMAVRTVAVGTGLSPAAEQLLKTGALRATALEDHKALGYEAVAAALADQPVHRQSQEFVCCLTSEAPVLTAADLKIALLSPNPRDDYWKTVALGAETAAGELGCQLVIRSPKIPRETLLAQEIDSIVADGVHAILAAPGESEAVIQALSRAAQAGVQVISLEEPMDGAAVTCMVEAEAAGAAAAQTLLTLLESWEVTEGSVLILGDTENSPAALAREQGFRQAMAETAFSLEETLYSGGDAAQAFALMEQHLRPKPAAVFCCGEAASIGAARAANGRGIAVVGWGRAHKLAELVDQGILHGAVTPDGEALGCEAVKQAVGISLDPRQEAAALYTGVRILTEQ